MAERISRKLDELDRQCGPAATAIGAVPAWPPVAPFAATMLRLLTLDPVVRDQLHRGPLPRRAPSAQAHIQWFGDAPLTLMVGSATVTNSEVEIQGLERGKQCWFRVRAVRAGKVGPWSGQATRVANI